MQNLSESLSPSFSSGDDVWIKIADLPAHIFRRCEVVERLADMRYLVQTTIYLPKGGIAQSSYVLDGAGLDRYQGQDEWLGPDGHPLYPKPEPMIIVGAEWQTHPTLAEALAGMGQAFSDFGQAIADALNAYMGKDEAPPEIVDLAGRRFKKHIAPNGDLIWEPVVDDI